MIRPKPGLTDNCHPVDEPLDQYIEAAERDNTRRSYASAVRHFEVEWKGLLPATSDAIARYLADHGDQLTCTAPSRTFTWMHV